MGDQDPIEVKDQRSFKFAMVDRKIILNKEISSTAKCVYAVLCCYANLHTLEARPGIARLAEESNLSKPTLRKGIKELRNKGIVEVVRKKTTGGDDDTNSYILHDWRDPKGGKNFTYVSNLPTQEDLPQVVKSNGKGGKKSGLGVGNEFDPNEIEANENRLEENKRKEKKELRASMVSTPNQKEGKKKTEADPRVAVVLGRIIDAVKPAPFPGKLKGKEGAAIKGLLEDGFTEDEIFDSWSAVQDPDEPYRPMGWATFEIVNRVRASREEAQQAANDIEKSVSILALRAVRAEKQVQTIAQFAQEHGWKAPTEKTKQVWDSALGQLQKQVSSANFSTWLRHTRPVGKTEGTLIIGTDTQFQAEWLSSRLYSLVKKCLTATVGEPVEVQFVPFGEVN